MSMVADSHLALCVAEVRCVAVVRQQKRARVASSRAAPLEVLEATAHRPKKRRVSAATHRVLSQPAVEQLLALRCLKRSQQTLCTAAGATFAHGRSLYHVSHQSAEGCAAFGGSCGSKCQHQPEHPHQGRGKTPSARCILSSPLLHHCKAAALCSLGETMVLHHPLGTCNTHTSGTRLVNAESVALCRV